ncbi:thymidylate synthase [Rubrobacter marinus]|uniref:thymidylate synthase n=1 Tax=Rubrobacter marinus TaxID=2653852 RepID=UPI00140A77B6|nr:thymidylate synthase [Rubrobacter marinus]
MRLFEGETANEAWSKAATAFLVEGEAQGQASRAGSTCEILHAVLSIRNPLERWVLAREPAINPAFAIAETAWILAGRDDSALPNHWYPGLPSYTGPGERYHGAYGHRLRRRFGLDQLERAYLALRSNPDSRQVVLQIWDADLDMPDEEGRPASQDVPCNVLCMLKVRNGKLQWTQVMRSNDLFHGIPYNLVQFTTLQEVIAGWLGLEVGVYDHLSDSLHVYESDLAKARKFDEQLKIAPNTDSLRLSKAESDETFALLVARLDAMTKEHLTERRMREIVDEGDLPEAFQNVLRIAAADSARRRMWMRLSKEVALGCTNAALLQAWGRWVSRTGTR